MMGLSFRLLCVSAVVCALALPTQADMIYSYDSGEAAGGITWGVGYLYALNIFPTGANNVIDQLQVGWGNLAPNTAATVVLYGMTSESASSASVLQVVNTTVTSDQTNGAGLSFDGVNNAEHFYTGTANIGNGIAGETPATITNPVWSMYNITPTTITTPYFGVATIVYDTNPTPSRNPAGLTTIVPGANISWVGFSGATYTTDITDSVVANNSGSVSSFAGYGGAFTFRFANQPYLIRRCGRNRTEHAGVARRWPCRVGFGTRSPPSGVVSRSRIAAPRYPWLGLL